MTFPLTGPRTWFGAAIALVVIVLDQATKLFVLNAVSFGPDGIVTVLPFMDLVAAWNTGISYGLFADEAGRWALFAIKAVAAVLFWFWLARSRRPLEATALGLLIGGAIGNAIDRVVHGAVFDFVLLHAFGHRWYVFNVADVAIVVGVGLLLYDSLLGGAAKSPPSDGNREAA